MAKKPPKKNPLLQRATKQERRKEQAIAEDPMEEVTSSPAARSRFEQIEFYMDTGEPSPEVTQACQVITKAFADGVFKAPKRRKHLKDLIDKWAADIKARDDSDQAAIRASKDPIGKMLELGYDVSVGNTECIAKVRLDS